MSSNTPSSSKKPPALLWFRNDLRLADNPALRKALDTGAPVIALYILEEGLDGPRLPGAAARWWLHHSLAALAAAIADKGGRLILRRGPARDVLTELCVKAGVASVFWNRRYEPTAVAVDTAIKAALTAFGIEVSSLQANLLAEPFALKNKSGSPFKVYTPFAKALRAMGPPRAPLPAPRQLSPGPGGIASDRLEDWGLMPGQKPNPEPDWARGLRDAWSPGEGGAIARLSDFIDEGLRGYAEGRDFPAKSHVSGLSPHLRSGEISPFQIWHATAHALEAGTVPGRDIEKFLSELIWREFCASLAFHQPDIASRPLDAAFNAMPWRHDAKGEAAWRRGQTGYPLVDAGMRQLWHEGIVHNRVRMVIASFLIKHLGIDWRRGEEWLWDTLVDADAASNPANWQWVAGCGADAAPYVRVFNPTLQGERFDARGAYVRRWVPELADLPDTWLHKPWAAPAAVLEKAGVVLGESYPRPIVDHDAARRRALDAYEHVRAERTGA
ncbi:MULTISPECIES: deoxyribodipyrimidine photo-lyase [unclassified Chelatococcus]|uniref:cryptochrome/photolyase family protein n=1 Tax=unclassified Chelatococcus TaxID=2638111 RepID=UPI001BCBA62B|nr:MULTISPECIES: deoxyribodipyrimidine photo-lyase [unclassified Chelatococcus]CAH1669897.1 Deoxyribodipyrimidine photo-lyase [Hyphomicrobiales bacterium]MBS7739276.1 deoxyribodipyrimidine photo-lyase [Chelatococcus sp. HY11]MBX3546555.1 deoxyribodipyrimidine photo-lyase [Chelatococcus sp.]MCO5076191.1 DNA photolyase family protein [Chelatococcus sp.]CAH1678659.1 Deoxyribodipyrimidine photo-lyase [Hyphomicrobiales bacterium]